MTSPLLSTVPCEICDNSPAKFYCNTCGDTLCPFCKTYHLKSKASKQHVVVPYAQKLDPKYLAGLLCSMHGTDAAEYWCDTCDVPICGSCVTEKHKGHQLSKITVMLSKKRDEMLEEMKVLRDVTVVEWEEVLQQAKTITTDFLSDIDKIEKELQERAKEMHEQVENILSQSRRVLQEMKNSSLPMLQKQEKFLTERLQKLKQDVERCEDQLKSADQNALLQFQPGTIECKVKPPILETATVPSFTKGRDDTNAMQEMFGKLSTEDTSLPKKSPASIGSTGSTCSLGSKSAPREQSGHNAKVPERYLIPNPSFQSQFHVEFSYPNIACLEQGLAWVQANSQTLNLVDRSGSVKDTINIDFALNHITVTSDGDLLLADSSSSSIKLFSRQKEISTLFKTIWNPISLCCSLNNDIVVAFGANSKVVIYSSSGQIKDTLDHIKFRYAKKVAVNKVNQDIYICDCEKESYKSPGKVIAVGADGQLRYEYSGQGDKKLTPADVCADQMGHILIIDYNNERVHILDHEGQFIQYILTSQYRPKTIDVDNDGFVWLGGLFVNWYINQIKVARYLE